MGGLVWLDIMDMEKEEEGYEKESTQDSKLLGLVCLIYKEEELLKVTCSKADQLLYPLLSAPVSGSRTANGNKHWCKMMQEAVQSPSLGFSKARRLD